ncbi:MAG: PAS domain-containing protein [Bacteroidetes bacterium]|nr:PAS domain-containing protein [Bacteroidota bacterium]
MEKETKKTNEVGDILVISNNKSDISLLKTVLLNESFFVQEINFETLAMYLLKEKLPMLILVNICTFSKEDFDNCRLLKKNKSTYDIPLLFIAPFHDKILIDKGFSLGSNDVIYMPFNTLELLAKIKTHIDFRHIKQEQEKIKERLLKTKNHTKWEEEGFNNIDKSLQKSYDHLLPLMEKPDGIIVFSLNKQYCYTTFTNSHKEIMRRIHGAEIQLGMNMLELIQEPEDRNKAKINFDRALAGEYFILDEVYGNKKLCRTTWENRYFPFYNNQKEIIGLTVFVVDITKRKQFELSLLESQTIMKAKIDSTSDFIWSVDHQEFGLLSWNMSLSQYFQKSRGIKIKLGMRPQDIFAFDTDAIQQWDNLYKKVLTEGPITTECKAFNGLYILHLSFNLLKRDGETFGISVFGKDITKIKESEKEIRTLSKTVEQSPFSIAITNGNREIIYINAQFTALMQYQLDEIKGLTPHFFNPIFISDEAYNEMWETLQSGDKWQGELQISKKDGISIWVNLIIIPLLDENLKIGNYVFEIEDITERKRILDDLIIAKEHAEESDKLKDAFLQNISHEVRTPMNAIMGFSELLNDPELLPNERIEYNEIIVDNCSLLLSIISDIVTIATIDTGQEDVNINKTEINKVCKLIYDQFILKAHKKNLALNYCTTLNDEDAVIYTDEIKLKQILTNLISNAIKFTKEGSVDFGYSLFNKVLEFYVNDSGIGIPNNKQHEIFKRFRQVEYSSTRKYGGTGLGLSISKEYVEMLGGTIRLNSSPNKGTTFYFTIPYNNFEKMLPC